MSRNSGGHPVQSEAGQRRRLVKVTVRVHPANVDRLKATAREWQVDAAAISPELWKAALECTGGDELDARQILEARLIWMGGRRLVDIAASGPEGLAEALQYLGQVAAGVYV